jgi:NADPH:quinone reductase-like Zn-dependent oxidoreductase
VGHPHPRTNRHQRAGLRRGARCHARAGRCAGQGRRVRHHAQRAGLACLDLPGRASADFTELGADRFIALDADRLEDVAGRADLVLDTIGGGVLARSPALLRPGGTLVTIKAAAQSPAGRDDIRQVVFVQESNRAQLIELARLVDQGHLRPQVGAVYPLAEAAKAFTAKAAGGIPGRVVLQP